MKHGDGGKGSGRRPGQIPDGAWERIFGDKKKQQPEQPKEQEKKQ